MMGKFDVVFNFLCSFISTHVLSVFEKAENFRDFEILLKHSLTIVTVHCRQLLMKEG